jgi:hypothetical protein
MREVFAAIVRAVSSNESGGTFGKNGTPVRYCTGYQVGLYGTELRFKWLDAHEVYEVCEWLLSVRLDVESGAFVGLWFDTDTGEYCLDVSVHIAERDRALNWGRVNTQKAVWDWANSESVAVV